MAKSPKKVSVKTKESMEVGGVSKLLSWVDLPLVKWQIFIKKLVLENRSRSGLPKVFTARCITVVRKKRTGSCLKFATSFNICGSEGQLQKLGCYKHTVAKKRNMAWLWIQTKCHCLLSGYHSALFPPPPPPYHPLCCGIVHTLPPFVPQTNTPSLSADPPHPPWLAPLPASLEPLQFKLSLWFILLSKHHKIGVLQAHCCQKGELKNLAHTKKCLLLQRHNPLDCTWSLENVIFNEENDHNDQT